MDKDSKENNQVVGFVGLFVMIIYSVWANLIVFEYLWKWFFVNSNIYYPLNKNVMLGVVVLIVFVIFTAKSMRTNDINVRELGSLFVSPWVILASFYVVKLLFT